MGLSCEICSNKSVAKGLCNKHYIRNKKYGSPHIVKHNIIRLSNDASDGERFWAKVEKTDSCWIWKGSKTPANYGLFWTNIKKIYAHRFSYQEANGDIPDGLVLDHLCRNPACVNPQHLEAVTHKVNILRGVGLSAQNARKNKCKRGHDFDIVRKNGSRCCSICNILRRKSYAI